MSCAYPQRKPVAQHEKTGIFSKVLVIQEINKTVIGTQQSLGLLLDKAVIGGFQIIVTGVVARVKDNRKPAQADLGYDFCPSAIKPDLSKEKGGRSLFFAGCRTEAGYCKRSNVWQ